jgi:hypothetical protein
MGVCPGSDEMGRKFSGSTVVKQAPYGLRGGMGA